MKQNGIYTKKVLDLFKKPHNYGRMKNPDGLGKVGNPVCLLPRQNICTNFDFKEINKITRKDKVLSHSGIHHNIVGFSERNYKGEIIIIKNKLGIVGLTPEHLVLAIKVPRGDKFLRTKNRKNLISAWYHSYQLKKGDITLYPILKIEKDLKYLEVNIPKLKWDFKSKEIPNRILLNSDFLRLVGYFLAEGNIKDEPSNTYISFTLNINERDIVEDIRKIVKNLFNLNIAIREKPFVKTVYVYLYNARVARFFKQLFGNGAEYKKLPDFLLNIPAEKQRSLIYGLWKGDGYINLERDGARAGYATISYQLAQQMKIMLLKQKIVPSIYIDKKRKINGVNHKKSYRIHIGQRESLAKLCSILGIKYNPKSYKSEKAWFDDNYLYTPITEIKKKIYSGKVYNLEVMDTHSFVAEAFCLHNCGDVMWLYIKVVKNKKNEETIKDIKFETFGCVAAIATSSIITDLVKGKTIKEALKVEKDDIVKSLGGLPKIKYHCSVLAVDALHKAIDDYLAKKKK